MQKFYFQCGTIPYISSQLSVPVLSATPPDFAPAKSAPPPKKTKARVPHSLPAASSPLPQSKKEPAALPAPAPAPTPLLTADVFGSPFSGGYNPFATTASNNPFAVRSVQACA